MAPRPVYRWTRDLHLYLGLLASPFVLVFALSVIFLNHAWLPGGEGGRSEEREARIPVPLVESDKLRLAKRVQREIGVQGEIDFINHNLEKQRLSFPITRPGHRTSVQVDLTSGVVRIEEEPRGVWDAMIYLHKMPGPHNVSVRGNWIYTRLWGWLADATVYLLLFVTASGVYLWLALRAERRAGMAFLGAGALTFLLIVLSVTA